MFDLDPLSRPVAVIEMLLLVLIAAFIGWVLARLLLNNRINALRSAIVDQEAELEDCRRSTLTIPVTKTKPANPAFFESTISAPSATVPAAPVSEMVEPDRTSPETLMADAPLALAPERPIISPLPPVPEPPVPAIAITTGGSETAVLQRIAARANELNFDRIGLASAIEADDLKDIVGIGPFLERKLHSLGIYTFRQIANFDKEDVDKVNDIIEFFPGRIERDNWVDQATVYYERKYGQREENRL